jgi:hypothetical protein
MPTGPISRFVDRHFLHFNAAALKDAAEGYSRHLASGGQMFLTVAGAMSTAELGVSLAEMIRQEGPRHLPHGREPRRGRLQSRRAFHYERCRTIAI